VKFNRWRPTLMLALFCFTISLPACSGADAVGEVRELQLPIVRIDGREANVGSKIRAGNTLESDRSGQVLYVIFPSGGACVLGPFSSVKVLPSKDVILDVLTGSSSCNLGSSGARTVLQAGGFAQITSAGSVVFSVTIENGTATMELAEGEAEMRLQALTTADPKRTASPNTPPPSDGSTCVLKPGVSCTMRPDQPPDLRSNQFSARELEVFEELKDARESLASPTPTRPAVTPTGPAITPTGPAVTPTGPAITPTRPTATPIRPTATPPRLP
jgi:hypothetical protein